MFIKYNRKNQSGFIIILLTAIITVLLLLLALYFLNFIITDAKIAVSHRLASQTYYLAEAGINEAIWKLSYDPTWRASFTTNPTWQAAINRTDIFYPNDSYQVTVQNLGLAEAEIIATAHINSYNQSSQRIVKTKVYQSLNPFLSELISMYTKNTIALSGSILNINDSNIYSLDDINLDFFSTLNVDGTVSAYGEINKSWTSVINSSGIYATNFPPPPAGITMPQIDFDSDNPNSYLNRADQVYTQPQFQAYLDTHPNAVFNGITYVQGNINLQSGNNITVNGLLVVEGNFKIGVSSGPFWKPRPNLVINKISGQPSGLISKKSITIGDWVDNINLNGLIYAANTFSVKNLLFQLNINGGVIAYQFDITSLWQPITINYDQEVVANTLTDTDNSPVINIEHWEEEY